MKPVFRALRAGLAVLSLSATASAQTPMKLGWMGDSITVGTNGSSVSQAVSTLTALGYAVTSDNRAFSGASTADWLPGGYNFDTAKFNWINNGYQFVHIMLGTNDVRAPNKFSAATHAANMRSIVNALVAGGLKVIISKPVCTIPDGSVWPSNSNDLYRQYFIEDMKLVDGINVFQGDSGAFVACSRAANTFLSSDGVHPKDATQNGILGDYWAYGITQRFGAPSGVVTLPSAFSGGGVLTFRGYQASPATVTSLAKTSATTTTLTLSWVEPGEAPATRSVTYRIAGTGAYTAVPAGSFGATGGVVTGLAAATAYDFQVVESNPLGISGTATLLNVSTVAAVGPPVSGFAQRYDATDPASLYSDTGLTNVQAAAGGTIAGWKNLGTGTGFNLVQGTSGNRPILAAADTYGMRSVSFSRANQQNIHTVDGTTGLPTGSFTLAMSFKVASAGNYIAPFGYTGSLAQGYGGSDLHVEWTGSPGVGALLRLGGSCISSSGVTNGNWARVVIRYNATSGDMTMNVNGATSSCTAQGTGTGAWAAFTLGALSTGGAPFGFDGSIGEFNAWASPLSDSEMTLLASYLGRWQD